MEIKAGIVNAGAAGENQGSASDSPEGLAPYYQDLRTRLIQHCQWVATIDRDEAVRAFNQYHESMPWLELKRKKPCQPK